MKKIILAVVLLSLVGSVAAAQVTWTVSPNPVPTKQPFRMTIVNNLTTLIQMNGTPWGIYDSNNKFIYPQIGLPFIIYLSPKQSTFWTWDGQLSANPSTYLTPGNYTAKIVINARGKTTTLSDPFTVLPDAITLGGTPSPGNNVSFTLDSTKTAAGLAYQVACSFGRTPGTSLGFNRELALGFDPLFISSLTVGPPTFQAFSGTLNTSGVGLAGVLIPNIAALKGQQFYVAYVTLKSTSPGGIHSYSYSKRVPIK